MQRWRWFVAVAALVACSPTKFLDTPPEPEKKLSMSLQASDITVAQGGESSVIATVTRVGGSAEATVSVENAPSDLTVSISNTEPVNHVFKSTITLRASADAKVGQYSLVIRARAESLADAVLTLVVTVLQAPNIALSLSSPSIAVARGGIAPATLRISRTNLPAAIALSVEGSTGITADFAANPATGDSVAVTVRAGSNLLPGAYQMLLRASVAGVADQRVPFTVNVIQDRLQVIGPNSMSIPQGQGASADVIVNQTDAPGTVSLSIDAPPSGITATFQPKSTGVVTMAIAVAPAVAPGAYRMTLRGHLDGVSDATTQVTINVVLSSVSLTLAPDSVIVFPGTAATATLSVARSSYPGLVAITAENVPTDVTVSSDPASVATSSATIRVQAGTNAAVGTTDVTIRGSMTGFPANASSVARLKVIVRPAPTSGNVILDWSRCGAPPFIAYQDGDGAWTPANVVGNVARFTIATPKGGFAFADGDGVSVRYMTQAELTASPFDMCPAKPGTNTVTGVAQHVTTGESFVYNLGGGSGTSTTSNPNIIINGVREGVHDLVAYGFQLSSGRAYLARDIDVPRVTSLGNVDLPGQNGFPVIRANATVTGSVLSDALVGSMSYLTTAACTVNPLYTQSSFFSGTQILGFPVSVQRPTDFHALTVTASRSGQVRSTTLTFHTFGNIQIPIQPVITTPVLETVPGGYLRERATFGAIPTGYNTSVSLRYSDGRHIMVVTSSIAYAGSTNPVLTMPDLSGVAGWQSSFAFVTGAAGTWTASADGSNGGAPCTEGRQVYNATVNGILP